MGEAALLEKGGFPQAPIFPKRTKNWEFRCLRAATRDAVPRPCELFEKSSIKNFYKTQIGFLDRLRAARKRAALFIYTHKKTERENVKVR